MFVMNTRTVLVALLLAAAAVLGSACQPHEIAAVRAVHQHRLDVQRHPFLTCVRRHESDRGAYPHINGYTAQNPSSSASGAYQFLDSTWRNVSVMAGHGGYAKASHAPWYVQDAVAHYVIHRPVRETGGRNNWAGTGC